MSEKQGRKKGAANHAAEHEAAAFQTEEVFNGSIEKLTPIAQAWARVGSSTQESMLRTLISSMQEAVMLVDRNLRVLEANDVLLETMGIPAGTRGFTLTRDIDPGEVSNADGEVLGFDDSVYVRCLAGEKIENHEQVHVLKDGTTRHFIINATPIRNENGEVEMALIVGREITQVKKFQLRTEHMLREMKRQRAGLQQLLNSIPAGVIVLDADLRVVMANRTYASYFEQPSDWRDGVHIADVLPLAEESGLISILNRALKSKRSVQVHDFRYDGFGRGTTYWSGAAVYLRLHTEQGMQGVVAMIALDVTEEVSTQDKLAELAELAEQRAAAIEREQAHLNSVIQSIPIPLVVCDAKRTLTAYNSAAAELFQCFGVQDHIIGERKMNLLQLLEAYEPEGTALRDETGPIARSLKGEVCREVIANCKTSGGGARVLSIDAAPLRDQNGRINGAVEAITDVTDRERAREQIDEIYRREHAIAEKLQRSFMAAELPQADNFDIVQRYRPALDEALVGGDFYDVFRLDEARLGIVMADVAGKGLKAAVYTAMTKYMLRAYALEESRPDRVLARLNEALSTCTPAEVFVTLVFGILDSTNKTFTYANAGHEQPILYYKNDALALQLDVTGRALALTKGADYSLRVVDMSQGNLLVLYTDGITDAGWGPNRLGQDRLLEMLQSNPSCKLPELADTVFNSALDFAGGDLDDDAALLLIRSLDEEQ